MSNGNGHLTPEQASKIFNELSKLDEGNETIMTESFGRFARLFPEHKELAKKIFSREALRPFREYRGD